MKTNFPQWRKRIGRIQRGSVFLSDPKIELKASLKISCKVKIVGH